MNSKWADYGFPDKIHLTPRQTIYHALLLALQERYAACARPFPEYRQIPTPMKTINIRYWCPFFDELLNGIITSYYDYEQQGFNFYSALGQMPESFLGEPVFLYEKHKFHNIFPLKWAIQRYKILNKMRRCLVGPIGGQQRYEIQVRSGRFPSWTIVDHAIYAFYKVNGRSAGDYSQERYKARFPWMTDASAYTFGTGVVFRTNTSQAIPGTVFSIANVDQYTEVADLGNMQGLAADGFFDLNSYYLNADFDASRNIDCDIWCYPYARISGDVEGGFEFLDTEEPEE